MLTFASVDGFLISGRECFWVGVHEEGYSVPFTILPVSTGNRVLQDKYAHLHIFFDQSELDHITQDLKIPACDDFALGKFRR